MRPGGVLWEFSEDWKPIFADPNREYAYLVEMVSHGEIEGGAEFEARTDYGEAVPPDAVFEDGRNGRQVHNIYPLLFNRAVSDQLDGRHADYGGRDGGGAARGSEHEPFRDQHVDPRPWKTLLGSLNR